MRPGAFLPLLTGVAVAAFAVGCGSSNKAPTSSAPSVNETATTSDPCQIVTASEAGALAGATFGPGLEMPGNNGGKACIYGFHSPNVFWVIFLTAGSSSAAQGLWSQELASISTQLQEGAAGASAGSGFTPTATTVSGADRAALWSTTATIGGVALTSFGVELLKGADFLAFFDSHDGSSPPGTASLDAQAMTSLARV